MKTMTNTVRLVPARASDALLLHRLQQFYYMEASRWSGEMPDALGLYDCDTPDDVAARIEQGEWAYFLHVDGALAGFVLVDSGELDGESLLELADLFVLPPYRRRGLASDVVRALVTAERPEWLLAVYRNDADALAYWRRALPRLPLTVQPQAVPEDAPFHLFRLRAARLAA